MAVDDRFEARIAGALHAYLDPAVGPHPRWDESPAAGIVRTGPPAVRVARRPDRSMLLVAAVLGALLIAGALVAGGALLRRPTPSPAPSPSASPSQPAVVAVPSSPPLSGSPTPKPCITDWSHSGTASPKGLVDGIRIDEFDGDGPLVMVFGHSIDSVRQITIAPAQPPFVNSAGKTVTVRGEAFYRLILDGLNRATQVPDNIGRHSVARFGNTVMPPIAALRRIQAPRTSRPVDGPGLDSTEVWIIGLDRPECLNVTTRAGLGFGHEPGDDAVIVNWDLPGDAAP